MERISKNKSFDLYHAMGKESLSTTAIYSCRQFYDKSLSWKAVFELVQNKISDPSISHVCMLFSLEFALKALILKSNPEYKIEGLRHDFTKMFKMISDNYSLGFALTIRELLNRLDLLSKNISAVEMRYSSLGDIYLFDKQKIDNELAAFFCKLNEAMQD